MGILQDEIEGDIGSVPRCQICGSERVAKDAWTCWNPESGLWELENVFDQAHCHQCEQETELQWVRQELPPNQKIRELNDLMRAEGKGRGSIMLTSGLQGMGSEFAVDAVAAVRSFDDFSDEQRSLG